VGPTARREEREHSDGRAAQESRGLDLVACLTSRWRALERD